MKPKLASKYDRGSRKHVLDLLDGDGGRAALNEALKKTKTGLRLAAKPHLRPIGRGKDVNEYELEDYLKEVGPPFKKLDPKWWISHRDGFARGPVWDLLAVLEPTGNAAPDARPGLLLVEAKAHASEFHPKKGMSEPEDTDHSRENAKKIEGRIKEAQGRLNYANNTRVSLPTTHHYQLVNRLAYACEMAVQGYDVVLMFLGFTGDTGFPDHFRDDLHWQREIGAYFHGVVRLWALDQRLSIEVHQRGGGGPELGSVRIIAPSMDVEGRVTPPSKKSAS